MDKKRKKTFISYVFLLALMVITVYLVLKSLDISMLSNVIVIVKETIIRIIVFLGLLVIQILTVLKMCKISILISITT